ncbi:FG-GAP repeat domain-containing protein, partial [Candidatus Moduliflexota bacterium]
WRNYSGGANYVWFMGMTMGNPVVTGGASLPGVSSSDWWIDASGDMNGDGHPDILWRNYDTGANYVWFLDMTMGNPVVTGGAGLPAQPNVDWVIEGLSDMNGDGAPDILWRNYLSGANYLWYMGSTMGSPVVTGGASLPTVPDWNWETGE